MSRKNIQEAIEFLRKGKLIVVADDDDREAEGDLVGVANLVSPESVNFMVTFARGLICTPVSKQIADRLKLREMVKENTDSFGTAFTVSVDHQETSTGISAYDRAKTIEILAKNESVSEEFHRPGHIFPLIGKEGGVLERRGHTEAAIDLAKLTNQSEVAYICEILNEDGTMARRPQLKQFAQKHKLPFITVEELVTYLNAEEPLTVSLPTAFGEFDLTLFEDQQAKEHLLLSKGEIRQSKEPLLVRVHSECLTGDIFGSHRCDCGEQLHEAMRMIEKKGKGAILYLRQEGRGIGLKNKLHAYQLQEQGMDTFDANLALGFKPDERDYQFAAEILDALGVEKIDLITNNPEKIEQLEALGININKRIPLEIPAVKENENYLKTKKQKFHHLLTI
ncbi:TPA: bifunctional 3,4-dihydroxy-2-butanone-4-phosphate synthase/GTP cyclohydrolase II [Enterococcus faecalis]|uniref:bifunctional 3,4-dihydroxy-2-butanone-4-phosphate synthase/GTP cyclohydrolase II n=1 Tax=Bacilli TaxID=91061 RepID=UPI000352C16B|nr:bifunctional 3,4-dihydroxy-2-butanone-4-phosphate synthase/GTP cyclohydrolase II [Enterococcus faecalis]EGO8523635.1 bifunctional 3,4-dihydroxy-2-butanone-4-phosphate synthase/GTP cyclohydrolase II [Enterococcus faecalis]EHS2295509.1 bifunctional 3,4-dihydroxy-2-butanone-4-phosphate synthase/GTP cyclohydrolase II [Enterococcus faecalis]EKF8800568.1 bifunctional 3,4-dihydroxy-2-butanone-4-phosphate synthase/GTP cyclohydrolase II [Enterococcus faecalis]EPH80580.1 3,4-dihydroxy-2-butanone-4-pho